MAVAGNVSHELFCSGVKHVYVSGSFVPNGANQLTNTRGVDVFGMGFSVARTGTGVFRVTITRPFANVVSLLAGITTDDANDHYVRVSPPVLPTSTANGYFDITHLSSSDVATTRWSAADITASGLLRKIHFQLEIAESDVPGAGV